MSVIHVPFLYPVDPDLSGTESIERWALDPGGGCPTLVGDRGELPAYVEVRALNPERGYARLRNGGLVRLGTPAFPPLEV